MSQRGAYEVPTLLRAAVLFGLLIGSVVTAAELWALWLGQVGLRFAGL
jgi:hypothetical protein